ncbi:MAG: uracil-DNA glycosylase family protein [Myxococcota bacterium]
MSDLLTIATELDRRLAELSFSEPVAFVYRPLQYAWAPHAAYLERYGRGVGRVLWLGMNPGPFGMAQTGVPFGEVAAVRDWLGIEGPVEKPAVEHPKRPIDGFACARSEVSGARLWGWAAERFGTAEAFFADHFIANYCPLLFLHATGRNLTPDKLARTERTQMLAHCDRALAAMIDVLQPRRVVGVGNWAEGRAKAVVGNALPVGRVLHPSPASPAANRGWAAAAEKQLLAQGIHLPTQGKKKHRP